MQKNINSLSELSEIFQYLRNNRLLCHITGDAQYSGIQDKGFILPNSNNLFDYSFTQSSNSYSNFKGYISLFDFINPSIDECIEESSKWNCFFYHFEPVTICLTFSYDVLINDIIPNITARKEIGYSKVWIPSVEVWYPEKLSILLVTNFIVISHKEKQFHFHVYSNNKEDKQRMYFHVTEILKENKPTKSEISMQNILRALSNING